jgi:hypothetical protein
LGEKGINAAWLRLPGAGAWIATGLTAVALSLAAAGCGGGAERQDVTEPAADFPVQVTRAEFPNRQQISRTQDLELEIRNVGDETIPDLAVTIYTGEEPAQEPFQIRLNQTGLADPNRPVWILEEGYPKLLTPGVDRSELDESPSSGAESASTNTFRFGEVPPGKSKRIVWRLTPVRGGTYPVNYQVAAGLQGKAKAVTPDGGPVSGQFVVTISTKVPQTHVTGSGAVEPVE